MDKIVIFGVGQIAEVAHFYLTHDSDYETVAFTADGAFIEETEYHGLPVVPFENIQTEFPPEKFKMSIPISYQCMNQVRKQKYLEAKRKGYTLISYVSSKATTWPNLKLGDNCFIFENNVIQPFVSIGNNVILWSGNHIGHHTEIGDHVFIASHVVVSGSVTIDPLCFLGVNSTIRDSINIGEQCLIGAGSVILRSTAPKQVYSNRSTLKPHPLSSDEFIKRGKI